MTREQKESVKPKWGMFKNRYRNPNRPWYAGHPFLMYCVQWIIYWSIFYPWINGSYKKGDRVKYNWMAKIQIYSTLEKMNKTRIVTKELYQSKSNLEFTDGDSCAKFWVRKLYFWES